jgi:hypothetical protein
MTDPGRESDPHGGEFDALVEVLGGVARRLRATVRSIPGVGPVEAQAEAAEQRLSWEIKKHLDRAGPPELPARSAPSSVDALPTGGLYALPPGRPSVAQKMQDLLTESIRSTPEDNRRLLYDALIDQLVPDEARILAALSDGSSYAMVHIAHPGFGTYQRRVLENASSVGRAAGVALPEYVHLYVAHLRRIGLVQSGPEEHSLKDEYDILLTDPKLRATIASIGRGPRSARVIRRTVRISDLGRELWEATHPRDVDGPPDTPAS